MVSVESQKRPTNCLIGCIKGIRSHETGLQDSAQECQDTSLMVASENLMSKPFINAIVESVSQALQFLWPRFRKKVFGFIVILPEGKMCNTQCSDALCSLIPFVKIQAFLIS